ncbi:MAG: hypothetical protein IT331_17155 [Anaerolineae bacterium]|nr:hypothetical protein [Anaerolineae bacterium]
MADTSITLRSTHDFKNENGEPFPINEHSDRMHGFYNKNFPNISPELWIISINGHNGVIDAGRNELPGKLLLRDGDHQVMLILDGATGETQQAGNIVMHDDVLVMRNTKIVIRLDGDNGDLLLGGGTPETSRIWLQSKDGNAYLGGNIRLEGGKGNGFFGDTIKLEGGTGKAFFADAIQLEGRTGIVTLGNASPATTQGASGTLLLNDGSGKTQIRMNGGNGNGQFGGRVSVGTTEPTAEQLHVRGSAAIIGDSAELKVEGKAVIGSTVPQDAKLHVEGAATVNGPFHATGATNLDDTLVVEKSVGIGAPATFASGKGILVSDNEYAGSAVQSGTCHLGLGVNANAGLDMLYWDANHDLALGTRSKVDGSGEDFEREVMKATSDGKVFVGKVEIDGLAGDIKFAPELSDCAEAFELAGNEEIEPGTVVVIENEGKLAKAREPYDRRVAGIISGAGAYRPGIILGQSSSPTTPRVPVALIGKVFCKVDADAAPIQVGDLLTTASTPGHAMKATDPARAFGAVIGKALLPLSSGKGMIPVLVGLQ